MEAPADDPSALAPPGPSTTTPEPAPPAAPPLGEGADLVEWNTETFTLEAGQERYLCFAATLEEDLVINGYHAPGRPFVHHLIFARASAPEPEGFAECDVAFRAGWETLFITGAGDTTLEFPEDAANELKAGTQLIAQMHLLNVSDAPVEGSVNIDMRRSTVENPRPVSSYILGTAAVSLPPAQTSDVVGTCSLFQPVHMIAGFPHMHLLGASMRVEVAKAGGAMQEVFVRDPFDFDDQRIDYLDLELAAGDVTRVSCTFDNPHDYTVGYGESTLDEMCYFVGFAVDLPRQSACLEVLPPNVFGP